VIADNGGLEMLSAPELATVGKELVIAGHPRLQMLDMTRLARVEGVRVEGNPKLAADVIEQLTSKSALDTPPAP
jgi:hypothetical protein